MATKSTKPHPAHRARSIVSQPTQAHVGWSIYPEQVPAMQRQLKRTILLHSADGVKDLQCVKDWAERTAAACLKSIGVDQSRIENPKSQISK